jgi:hypothetical protein
VITVLKNLVLGCATIAVSALVLGTPANAKGCGGYVNMAVWGCAPWDNNPPKKGVTPGYPAAKPVAAKPAPAPRVVAQPVKPVVQPGARVIGQDGAGARGGQIISSDGASRPTGGQIISNDGASRPTGGSLISNKGGGVVGNGGPLR